MSNDVLLLENERQKDSFSLIKNEHVSIDVTTLTNAAGNDMNFTRTAIHAFLKKMPDILDKIEDSLKKQDWDNVYKLAHAVRSSICIIKIDKLCDWVTQMEINARDRKGLSAMPELIRKIRAKYHLAEIILSERFY